MPRRSERGKAALRPVAVCAGCRASYPPCGSTYKHQYILSLEYWRIISVRCCFWGKILKRYDLSQLVVLVAERNSFLRLTIKSILRTLRVGQIIDASEIEDAWQSFQTQNPDVVIIDWAPGYEGLQLLKRMRQDPESRNVFIPVIITTSMTEYENVVTARDSGTTDFLAKPYSPKTIYQHLCKIIDSRKSFVRTRDFFGPDRRSRGIETTERRRTTDTHVA